MNCDRVFDILTRGPFPTGQASDDAVEQHLRACHDCRQLAEALRPAVEMLHEAIDPRDGSDLPGYRGALRRTDYRGRSATTEAVMRQVAHLPKPGESASGAARMLSWMNFGRFVAATALGAGIILLLHALSGWGDEEVAQGMFPALPDDSPATSASAPAAPAATARRSASTPSESGRLALANLRLPVACLALPGPSAALFSPLPSHSPQSHADGSAYGFQCCKQCHADGSASAPPAWTQREAAQQCFVCHRSEPGAR